MSFSIVAAQLLLDLRAVLEHDAQVGRERDLAAAAHRLVLEVGADRGRQLHEDPGDEDEGERREQRDDESGEQHERHLNTQARHHLAVDRVDRQRLQAQLELAIVIVTRRHLAAPTALLLQGLNASVPPSSTRREPPA
jgi:hypothetical protein